MDADQRAERRDHGDRRHLRLGDHPWSSTRGPAPHATAVGAFQVALAASASGIRDALGNQAAFPATAPADRAGPVPVASPTPTDGQLANRDDLAVTFSEAIASGAPGSTTITEARSGGTNTLAITVITAGALDLGSNNYLGLSGNSISFAGTVASGNSGRTLTVSAGGCTSGLLACLLVGAGSGTTLTYVPAPPCSTPPATPRPAAGSRASGCSDRRRAARGEDRGRASRIPK